jgi:hypothetical protein
MANIAMWTSKLGNKYPMASIQQSDQATQKELKRLRSLRANQLCFDCGRQENSWSSVDHGVFLCIVCSDVHRSVGTHITKTKGCTGTYLWGPDELEKMQTTGNHEGEARYGTEKVSPDASKECKQQHVVDKYEKRLFAPKQKLAPQLAKSAVQKMEQQRQKAIPSDPLRFAAKKPDRHFANSRAMGQEVSKSLFDELFNEPRETRLVDEINVTQPDAIATTIHNVSEQNSNLDDFLDSMLLPATTPTRMNRTLLTSSANNRGSGKKTFAEDPFFDWDF